MKDEVFSRWHISLPVDERTEEDLERIAKKVEERLEALLNEVREQDGFHISMDEF